MHFFSSSPCADIQYTCSKINNWNGHRCTMHTNRAASTHLYSIRNADFVSKCNFSLIINVNVCLCAQVWAVLCVSDSVLHSSFHLRAEIFFLSVWECGYVFGLPSFARADSQQCWRASKQRAALMARQPAHPLSRPFFHLTTKPIKLLEISNEMRSQLLRDVFPFLTIPLSLSSLWLSCQALWKIVW